MSTPLQFLICADELHSQVVDGLICEYLRDVDGNKGSRWSGVYTAGGRFGVVWDSLVAALFAETEVEIATALLDEQGRSNWTEVTSVVEETPL